jgi:DNA polymerase-1
VKRFFLVDGSSYFYRAFFGLRGLATSKGFPTNAIYVFTTMLQKVLKSYRPDYLAIVFDAPGRTFRDDLYKEYKGTRQPMPEELSAQIPHIKKLPGHYRVKVIEQEGVEADDVIGTLATRALAAGVDVVVVTGDKDLMQLVTKQADDAKAAGIALFDDMKDRHIGINEVREKFGVGPERVTDIQALIGDTSDNIPGVHGIGEKTAAKLVAEHGPIEQLYAKLPEIPERIRKMLEADRENAFLSKRLATIKRDVDLPFALEEFRPGEPDRAALAAFFEQMEFGRLLQEVQADRPRQATLDAGGYRLVRTTAELDAVVAEVAKSERLSFDLETTGTDPMRAQIVGFSVCSSPGAARYIPVAHRYLGVPEQLPLTVVLEALRPALATKEIVGSNLKYDGLVLRRAGGEIGRYAFDTMLASYLINPDKEHGLKSVSREWLNHQMTEYAEVAGKGKGQISFEEVPVEAARDYSCQDSDVAWRLVDPMEAKLRADGLHDLMTKMELPLLRVLLEMEHAGVKVDVAFLKAMSGEFQGRIRAAMAELQQLAGEEFNPDSPKQLQHILFEKLGLEPGKKTKTGYSTDVSVLEELAAEHPLPRKILEYRQLAKLKGTYIDALPAIVHPETGRVHTTYHQAVAATGRLSSSDPNLQNIPIRTAEGRLIRKAFVPEKGRVLVGLDYSQIELRIMAHLSDDPKMIAAFREDGDVHRATAAEVFGVAPGQVTDEQRSRAKAINFGIIYGMGAFGLGMRLGINQKEAADFIHRYFERYARVRSYIDASLAEARKRGYVTTLFGRRRYVPELASRNRMISGQAERIAVNAPIQGTAADLMKVAMINVAKRLAAERLDAPMILQVHDELVLEAPEGRVDDVTRVVKEEMEGVYPMKIPLKVDTGRGPNWAEME